MMSSRLFTGVTDITAARALFRAAQSQSNAAVSTTGSALLSAAAAASSSCLAGARQLYAACVAARSRTSSFAPATTGGETINFALPSVASVAETVFPAAASTAGGVLSGDVVPAMSAAVFAAGGALWKTLVALSKKAASGKLALVVRYLLANPSILCGGATAVTIVAGVAYLCVTREVVDAAVQQQQQQPQQPPPPQQQQNNTDSSTHAPQVPDDAPRHLVCPITCELFVDPVMIAYGHSFERNAIETWVTSGNNTLRKTLVALSKKAASGKLALVVRYLLANPSILCGGATAVTIVAGVAYLCVTREVVDAAVQQQQQQPQQQQNNTDSSTRAPQVPDDAPRHLVCPITCELFVDPVVIASGHSFERNAIEAWVTSGNTNCPLTRHVPISLNQMVPNINLRHAVAEYVASRQQQRNPVVQESEKK